MAIMNPEDIEGALGDERDARIRDLEAELTQARAERDAAREALEKADKMNEVLNASTSGHFWADIADAQEEYIAARAAIKAEGE